MDHGLGPELVELRQAILRGVPSQDGSCDGPNGRADNPVRPNAALMQMLVSACMVSAEGIPAPKHESSPGSSKHTDPLAAAAGKEAALVRRPKSREETPKKGCNTGTLHDAALQNLMLRCTNAGGKVVSGTVRLKGKPANATHGRKKARRWAG